MNGLTLWVVLMALFVVFVVIRIVFDALIGKPLLRLLMPPVVHTPGEVHCDRDMPDEPVDRYRREGVL